MGLFREEVFTQRTENLHGTINLAVPISWHIITSSLAAIIVIAALFLFSASYSRTEIASGSVLPSGGLLKMIPPRPGRIEAVTVREGQAVRKGEQLALIRAEQTNGSGNGTQTEILSAIERQQRGLEQEQALTLAAASSEQGEYDAQISGLRQEARNIQTQVAVQRKLVEMAQADFSQAAQIASRGFISRRDLAEREQTLLSRQQQLSVLMQSEDSKRSSIEQTTRARRQAAAKASSASAGLVASQAQIERERAATRGEQGYALVAPLDGRVAALNLHVGDAVNAQDAAMMIVPSRGRLVAQLYIPGKAAGFIRLGQPVRLAMDAYPYERFGTVGGLITTLSTAPVMRTGRDGSITPFYIATADIKDPAVRAYGMRQALLPGMTFTAHILVEHRSIIQWLFDPLFAAARQ
jgi:membrane fusion protein